MHWDIAALFHWHMLDNTLICRARLLSKRKFVDNITVGLSRIYTLYRSLLTDNKYWRGINK